MNELATILNTEIIARFIIELISMIILLRFTYYRHSPNRDTLFGFMLFGVGVFLITGLLHDVEMSMGFAFGLFAVFSMLRYRTESISIRDMTYLFVVIVISLMSSVGPVTIPELVILNSLVCTITAVGETTLLAPKLLEKKVVYEKIENIITSRHQFLINDLSERMGLDIQKLEVGNVDYLRDTADLKIYYTAPEPSELEFSMPSQTLVSSSGAQDT